LISPAFLFIVVMLLASLATLVLLSFKGDTEIGAATIYTLDNYRTIFSPEGDMYRALLLRSLWIPLLTTVAVILFAYPFSYILAFHIHRFKAVWLILVTIPFWISYFLRVASWKVILGENGVINSFLAWLGLTNHPLEFLLYNRGAVVIVLTHSWLVFAILPIYVSLEKMDKAMLEAARDLGDNAIQSFLRITLPLSLPGVFSAAILIFVRTAGDYVTPSLFGGISGTMIGNLIVALFTAEDNAPLAAAVSVLLMLLLIACVCAVALSLWCARKWRARA
jgi:spermidine/putrescine transport system permease protein